MHTRLRAFDPPWMFISPQDTHQAVSYSVLFKNSWYPADDKTNPVKLLCRHWWHPWHRGCTRGQRSCYFLPNALAHSLNTYLFVSCLRHIRRVSCTRPARSCTVSSLHHSDKVLLTSRHSNIPTFGSGKARHRDLNRTQQALSDFWLVFFCMKHSSILVPSTW